MSKDKLLQHQLLKFTKASRQHCVGLAEAFKWNELYDYLKKFDLTLLQFRSLEHIDFVYKQNGIYLAPVSEFNDEFDCCWVPEHTRQEWFSKIRHILNHTSDNLTIHGVMGYRVKENFTNHLHVACFSEKSNLTNLKMWYYYANRYRGICLEYDIADIVEAIEHFNDECKKCLQNNIGVSSEHLNRYVRRIVLAPVIYTKSVNNNVSTNYANVSNISDKRSAIQKDNYITLCAKHKCWQDERE